MPSKVPFTPIQVPQFDLIGDFADALSSKRDVSIVEFAESDQFCNKPLYPRQKLVLKLIFLEELDGYEEDILQKWIDGKEEDVVVCPMIRERIQWCRDEEYPHFSIVQLIGGRRSSKGYVTGIAIAKKIWDFVQMDDPGERFGIDPDKDIYFEIIAASKEQAKKHQFADARAAVESCRALEKHISRVREEGVSIATPADLKKLANFQAKNIDVQRDIARLKLEAFATTASTVRGSAAVVLAIDEMAHLIGGDSSRSDEEVYEAAAPSLAQFGKDSLLFANSSPYTEIGKFYKLYESVMKIEDGFPIAPQHLMLNFPSWQLYLDYEKDGRFQVPILTYDSVKHEERINPEKFAVEYRGKFAKVVDAFLNPDRVDEMFEGNFLGRKLVTQEAGARIYAPYKIHGDPSSTTANFGFAVGHVEFVNDPENPGMSIPHVVFDLIDAFYPEDFEDHTIDWTLVMPEFVSLIERFRPQEMTFDQFDSTAPLQFLRKAVHEKGIWDVAIKEKVATKKVNKRRCDNFKAALYLGQVHASNPEGQRNQKSLALARNELKFLQEKAGKIDKQDLGPVQTKDMADAIIEVTDYLIGDYISTYKESLSAEIRTGSQGGYQMGRGDIQEFYKNRSRPVLTNAARGRGSLSHTRRYR